MQEKSELPLAGHRALLSWGRKLFQRHDLALILLLALIPRLFAAWFSQGFNHPDEHFQVLEPAYGLIHHFWVKSWEWDAGMRSFVLPYFFSWLMRGGRLLSLDHPNSLMIFIRVIMAFFSLLSVWAVYRICQLSREPGKDLVARLASLLMALWWLPIYFSVRTLSEAIATPLLLLGHYFFLLSYPREREEDAREVTRGHAYAVMSALFFGLCFWVRFQTGFFSFTIFLLYLNGFRLKRVPLSRPVLFAGALLLMIVVHGFIDLFTWGRFLNSPVAYFMENIWAAKLTNQFGHNPWHRYFTMLIRFFSAPGALLVVFFSLTHIFHTVKDQGPRAKSELLLMLAPATLFWLVHQSLGHKEDRFLLPLVPYFFIIGAGGFVSWSLRSQWLFRHHRKKVVAFLLLTLLAGNLYKCLRHEWNHYGDLTRLYAYLHDRPDITGLAVWGHDLSGTAGYFYLDRDIPLMIAYKRPLREFPLKEVPRPVNFLLLYSDEEQILSLLKKSNTNCIPIKMDEKAVTTNLYKCSGGPGT